MVLYYDHSGIVSSQDIVGQYQTNYHAIEQNFSLKKYCEKGCARCSVLTVCVHLRRVILKDFLLRETFMRKFMNGPPPTNMFLSLWLSLS